MGATLKYSAPWKISTVIDLEKSPCPSICASGLGGAYHGQYWIEDDGKPMSKLDTNKPPYRVPLMSEIREIPWNGFRVASTFSGAGGSCTGYRMAGFKVVWANEFVPAAQASYKANCASDSILDCRDIKLVQASEILAATGLKVGELDIFDGSPPCQAFSTAGKREKGWGKDKSYEHGAKQKNETLFDEYTRLLRGLKPKVFVAENVSGLVKGTAKGYFLEILAALKASGYRVTCRVLDAQWLGVPQQRQRTIFVGVREDLKIDPVHPKPLPYRYSVRDALPWIVKADHDTSGLMSCGNITDVPSPAVMAGRAGTHFVESEIMCQSGAFPKHYTPASAPAPAVMAGRTVEMKTATEKRKFTIAELRRICAFPDDFILCGSYAQQWERLGNSVPPLMMKAIASTIRDEILSRIK
jgi:DNA (cytosine-5)-methyltransferase 1